MLLALASQRILWYNSCMKNKMTTEPIPIRRVGGSLYMKVPVELVHANGLKPGDFIMLNEVTIIKAASVASLGEKVMLEAS
jgi:hypothetical protein